MYIIGTERHEARRIDNQLRGRSGRLGDPGVSIFFLSLEDDLIRRFGGERVTAIMDRLGLEEDQPIKHNMISKAIENAQTRVEGHNFDIRKHVLKYDEVVNEQRETIYAQRRRILYEPSLKPTIQDMIADEIQGVVQQHTDSTFEEEWNQEELDLALRTVFPFPQDFDPSQWQDAEDITDHAIQIAHQIYDQKEEEVGADRLRDVERQIMLHAVDHRWVRHLTDLDRLREGIGLQAIAQVDPLVVYKREAFAMYQELMNDIRSDIVKTVMSVQIHTAPSLPTPIAHNIRTNRQDISQPKTVRNTNKRPKRNHLCWCGSGKKYKHCHMKTDIKQSRSSVPEMANPSGS